MPKTALLAALALSLLACSALADDETDSAAAATTIGSRWRSPLDEGAYDVDGAKLLVFGSIDTTQRVWFTTVVRDALTMCSGSVDVADGKLQVDGDGTDGTRCSIELVKTATGIHVRGTAEPAGGVDVELRLRATNAFVGKYEAQTNEARSRRVDLEVEGSTSDGVVFSMTVDGKPLAQHVTAKAGTGIELDRYEFSGLLSCAAYLKFEKRNGRYQAMLGVGETSFLNPAPNVSSCTLPDRRLDYTIFFPAAE